MEGGGTGFEELDGKEEWGEEREKFVMGPVKKGSLVLIHGNVLHKSERNTGKGSRFIYTFHVSTYFQPLPGRELTAVGRLSREKTSTTRRTGCNRRRRDFPG